jgi:predicted ATPase/DNA-binding CsgD family transcriptional regulator
VAVRPDLLDAGVSEREAEVLELVAQHATNAEIAARLFVSVRTVESHVSSLLRKLDASDRRALARLASGGDTDGAATAPVDTRAVGGHDGDPTRVAPVPLTSFVGRAAELADLTAAVSTARLVTAIGPGGVGKTRLALALAGATTDHWRDGVWFVDLVPVGDEALVPATVGRALGLGDPVGERTAEEHLLAHLADREALIVLDNCEHVVAGAAVFVERLLSACAGISVLATSQARLMLPFERVFSVPGLSLPHDDQPGDAVSLFVERAAQAGAAPPPGARDRVAEICRRLDGSALAIELAAARLPSLGLDGLERGLAERFDLLAGGSRLDERHTSLLSAIDWSYGLLDDGDRALLRQVTIFAAPFTTDAAVAVTDLGAARGPHDTPGGLAVVAAGLGRLAEHSLLVTVPGTPTRHRVLDSIRQYGLRRMAETPAADEALRDQSGTELDVVRRRHHAWVTGEVRALDAAADVPLRDALDHPGEAAAWRDAFDRVADDARAALQWADHAGHRAEAYATAVVLASTALTRGLLREAQRHHELAAARAPDAAAAISATMDAAGAASGRHVGNDALRLLRAAADRAVAAELPATAAYALARAAELLVRAPGIIAARPPDGTLVDLLDEARPLVGDDARARTALDTVVAFDLDETDPAALDLARSAVDAAADLRDPLAESAALDALAAIHLGRADLDAARDASRRRTSLLESVRPTAASAFEITDGFHMASEIALAAGDFPAARHYALTPERLSFQSEDAHLATSRILKVDAMAGAVDRVLADGARFRAAWQRAGRPVATNLAGAAYAVAMVHGLRGDDEARADWVEVTRQLGVTLDQMSGCSTGYVPMMDAIVDVHRGEAARAVRRLESDPADFRRWYTGEWRTWYAALHAEAAVLAGLDEGRDRVARARALTRPNAIADAMLDRAEALLDDDVERLGAVADTLADSGCPYQWARSLVLAGGAHAERGRRGMAELGVAPMSEATAPT